MADHDELIAQFIEVSGGDEDVAKFYLSSSNWNLENAIANFLGSQSEDNDDMANNAETAQPAAAARNATTTENAAAKPAAEDFAKTAKGAKPKFATLQDMSNRPADEEEGQAFYAGGSERSGQQVLGPPKRKNFREQLTEMFRMAQEQSPETIDTHLGPSTSAGPQASNWGQGVRLGMTSSDHAVVTATNAGGAAAAAGGQKKPVVVLKLWSQGFSIDDGELRLYDDPQNKEFLETVMRGEIPHELLEMGWMVNVDVEDHRQEDYKKTTPKQTFKGSGHALGSPTPNIVETVPTSVPAAAAAAAPSTAAKPIETTEQTKAENLAKEQLKLDASAPTTTLQIRLADGSRLSSQFNLTHTVADIQQYIRNARPQYAERNFVLVSSFPTREISDNAATVESAGLKNAALMQRLK